MANPICWGSGSAWPFVLEALDGVANGSLYDCVTLEARDGVVKGSLCGSIATCSETLFSEESLEWCPNLRTATGWLAHHIGAPSEQLCLYGNWRSPTGGVDPLRRPETLRKELVRQS